LITLACFLWSLSTVLSGSVNSLFVFVVLRILYGGLQSASGPLMYSLISDYFPSNKLTTPNSAIQAGRYVGSGVSTICLVLINKYGWRNSYKYIGYFGILTSIASLILVKEP
jgi:ACS family hexuronate transporter-like MFS transporter